MLTTTKPEFRRGFSAYLRREAESRRRRLAEVPSERVHQNRASARLSRLADHVERQDDTHLSLSDLYARVEASADGPIDYTAWRPNDAQVESIQRYAGSSLEDPEALLAELVTLSQ